MNNNNHGILCFQAFRLFNVVSIGNPRLAELGGASQHRGRLSFYPIFPSKVCFSPKIGKQC